MIDKVPMVDRDTKGDIYEYMLAHRSRRRGRTGNSARRVTSFS